LRALCGTAGIRGISQHQGEWPQAECIAVVFVKFFGPGEQG
jgi:hypothetical protein